MQADKNETPGGVAAPAGPDIEVANIRPLFWRTGVATFSIILRSSFIVINGCVLHKDAAGERLVQLPSHQYTLRYGWVIDAPIIRFTTTAAKNAFYEAVLSQLDALVDSGALNPELAPNQDLLGPPLPGDSL